MASEQDKLIPHQQDALGGQSRKTLGQQFLQLDRQFLQQIIDNSFDSMFVTDRYGNVLLAIAGTGKFMETRTEEMVGKNVQDFVKRGVYDWSPTMKAIKTRTVVSGLVRNNHGDQQMATSKPLIDKNDEIIMGHY